jgi:hypothetical protein
LIHLVGLKTLQPMPKYLFCLDRVQALRTPSQRFNAGSGSACVARSWQAKSKAVQARDQLI